MKTLLLSTFAAFISLRPVSAAPNAPFFTWPNTHTSSRSGKPEVLSHIESRLSLASRLGLSQFHHIGANVDIYKLQRVSSSQQRLWTEKYNVDGTVVIIVGGVSNADAFWSDSPTFEVESSPSFGDMSDLSKSLISQTENIFDTDSKSLYANANGGSVDSISPSHDTGIFLTPHLNQWDLFESSIGPADASRFKSNNKVDVDFFEEYMVLKALTQKTIDQVKAEKATVFIHLGSLDAIALKDGVNSQKHKVALKLMSELLNDVIKATSEYPSIVGLIPPTDKNSKRGTNLDFVGDLDLKKAKRKEAPLAPTQVPKFSGEEESSPSSPATLFQKGKIFYPRPGCFKSSELCGNTTNSCNGRGQCMKSATQSNCWSCACDPTVVKVGGLNKTTYWGGNACQKEDISVPFLLFATLAIGITLTLIWTVGTMVSMGGEELPGELSAGVALVRK